MHTHLLLAAVFLVLCGISLHYRRHTVALVRDYFSAVGSPINLAVFRIVLFAVIFHMVDIPTLIWFSRLPTGLIFPPNHTAHLLPYIPINAALVTAAGYALLTFCLMALVGLWTPVSCALTALLGVYVFGVPDLFGKINHNHHVLWFAALMAAAPCSDVLSLDAVWRAWKRADHGITAPPAACRAYALPLRFVWILMGLAYFFPGFWKLWHSGLAWALSGNLKYFMYESWTLINGFMPTFRIDRYPLLIQVSGLGTLLFETTFLSLIFFPRLRSWLVPGGLLFHNMTNYFLHISFWFMQWMYVSFVPWDRVFLWAGRRLFPTIMYVRFNGDCRACRRTVASLRVFDVLGRITWDVAGSNALIPSAGAEDWQVIVGEQHFTGSAAFRAIAPRIPVLWPILPLLSLPQAALGKALSSRHEPAAALHTAPALRTPTRLLIFIGTFLVFTVFAAGVRKDEYSWPIACYPTFDLMAGPTKTALRLTCSTPSGRTLNVASLSRSVVDPGRYEGLTQSLLAVRDAKQQQFRLRAYWQLYQQNDPTLAKATDVRFYRDLDTVVPGQTSSNPLRRTLIYEYK